MVRGYECMLILLPQLAEEIYKEIFQKILKKIESLGGKIISEQIWAKEKDFCYPIRSRGAEKKKYTKGCYWLIYFMLDTDKLPDLKETIRLEERILRGLILRKDDLLFQKEQQQKQK